MQTIVQLENTGSGLNSQELINSARQELYAVKLFISALPDGVEKAAIQVRANNIQAAINIEQITVNLMELEGLAPNLTTQQQVDEARQMLSEIRGFLRLLPESETKTSLQARFDSIRLIINSIQAIMDAKINITAKAASNSITLTWEAVKGAAAYEIEADGAVINNDTSTIYIHKDLSPDTRHTYRVRARNAATAGNWSDMSTITTLLLTPSNVNTTASVNNITVKWEAVSGASGYEIQVNGSVLDKIEGTTYIHKEITPNIKYIYGIRAINNGTASEWSQPVTGIMTDRTPPVIIISGLKGGGSYTDKVTPNIEVKDDESGIKSQGITLNGKDYIPGTEITAPGAHELTVTANDNAGNVTTKTALFSLYASTKLAVTAITAQYSDLAQLTAKLTTGDNPVPGKTVVFKINGMEVGMAATSVDGTAYVSNTVKYPRGKYLVTAAFIQDETGYLRSSEGNSYLEVLPEKADVKYMGQLLVKNQGAINLAAKMTQENDDAPGDLKLAGIRFDVSSLNIDGKLTNIGYYTADCSETGEASTALYLSPGVYSVTAAIIDDGYYMTDSDAVQVIVYDPAKGFITGDGRIINITDPVKGNKGRADFEFEARYKDEKPEGDVEFHYKDMGIDFKSKRIDWLAIGAEKAAFQGSGTIKGREGIFTFQIQCTDYKDKKSKKDSFAIKIWAGLDTTAEPVYMALNQPLVGGNIRIHTK